MTALSFADIASNAGIAPLMSVSGLAKNFGERVACREIGRASCRERVSLNV